MLEEGVLTDAIANGLDLTEIQIVPPSEQLINIGNYTDANEVNGAELSVVENDISSSDEYDTADSNVSGPESDAEPAQQ